MEHEDLSQMLQRDLGCRTSVLGLGTASVVKFQGTFFQQTSTDSLI